MDTHWSILPPVEPPSAMLAAVGGHPLVATILAQRGHSDPESARAFLDPRYYQPAPPSALVGVDAAVEVIAAAVVRRQRIMVWGDFDVDGQTSTALLVDGLQHAANGLTVGYHIPNRLTDGHGIRVETLERKIAEFRPDLIVTCDTGITDGGAVAYAKRRGIRMVITDHHDLSPELRNLDPAHDRLWGLQPDEIPGGESVRLADVVVNPKFQAAGDPLRTLPGVGVAYKLMQALYGRLGRAGEEQALLDLVALGIVADVAEQVHDARYLLQIGLERLRATRRAGLLALMEVARVAPGSVDAQTIGFQVGPRLNALGRLEDATAAVELLTTDDANRAALLAAKLERLNQQRRLLTSQIAAVAMEMVERNPSLLDFRALVVAHPAWHPGIVGIVASQLAEQFHRPTVLLIAPPGEPARGSARSVPGVDIGGAIAACADLLLSHGGHPGAAGLTLQPENIDRFRRALDRQIERHQLPEIAPGLTVDAVVDWGSVDLYLAGELARIGPFGNGNPAPQLMSTGLSVVEDRRLGRDGSHRRLVLGDSAGATRPVLWFKSADVDLPAGPLDLVFTVGINEYNGQRSLQVVYVATRPAQQDSVAIAVQKAVTVHDLRRSQGALRPPDPGLAVWYAEGTRIETVEPRVAYAPRTAIGGRDRGRDLVIYSAPPSYDVLRWLFDTVRPGSVYLIGRITSEDGLDAVVRQIAGMCRYALQRERLLQIDRMAARLGTTEGVIRRGLLWLQSRGHIDLVDWQTAECVEVAAGIGPAGEDESAYMLAQLEEQLAEVRAYRRYLLRAPAESLGLPLVAAAPAPSSEAQP
jgi:single-stranded-DNA-specific exonuclease